MVAPTKDEITSLLDSHAQGVSVSADKARNYDDARTWVDPNGYRLSDRIWNGREANREQINQILRDGVANRQDALVTAKQLEQFLNPAFAVTRDEDGRIIKAESKGLMKTVRGRGGTGSHAARRLAVTEVSRAHAQEVGRVAQETPFAIGQRWNLSPQHPRTDGCDVHTTNNVGLGPGVYPVDGFPRMPDHPWCMCYATVEVEADDDKIVKALRQEFGLADGPGLEALDRPMSSEVPGAVAEPSVNKRYTELKKALDTGKIKRDEYLKELKALKDEAALKKAGGKVVPKPDPTPPRPGFTPARSVAEAKRTAVQYNLDLQDVTVADLDIFNHLGPRLDDMHAKDLLTGKPRTLKFVSGRDSDGIAAHIADTDVIEINRFYKDVMNGTDEATFRRLKHGDYLASKDPGDIVVHEFGHQSHYRLDPDRFRSFRYKDLLKDEIDLSYKEISRYASINPYEFVAETYMKAARGDVLSDDVLRVYRKYGGSEDVLKGIKKPITKLNPDPIPLPKPPVIEKPPMPDPGLSIAKQYEILKDQQAKGLITRQDYLERLDTLKQRKALGKAVPKPAPAVKPIPEVKPVPKKPSDPFVDKVQARIAKGVNNETDAREVGAIIREEIEAQIKTLSEDPKTLRRLQEIEDELEGRKTRLFEMQNRRADGIHGKGPGLTHAEQVELDQMYKINAGIMDERTKLKAKLRVDSADVTKDVLARVRPMSGKNSNVPFHPVGVVDKPAMLAVKDALDYIPTAWADTITEGLEDTGRKFGVSLVKRGQYSDQYKHISISGTNKSKRLQTAIHELGHAVEYTRPGITQLERQFFERRTSGESSKWLGPGYRQDEVTKKDKFLSPYMGKEYSRVFEILTMGIEGLLSPQFNNYDLLTKDTDYADFILGLLGAL